MNHRVAVRYAKALFETGRERATLETLSGDMTAIQQTIHDSRELRAILASPVVKGELKLGVLAEIFGKQVSAETMAFISLLVKKGREGDLYAVTLEFAGMMDRLQGVVSAQITSALALSQAEQDAITARLQQMSGKRVRTSFDTDPALRGGFIARMGDTLIDASLKHQLEALREQFLHGGTPILN